MAEQLVNHRRTLFIEEQGCWPPFFLHTRRGAEAEEPRKQRRVIGAALAGAFMSSAPQVAMHQREAGELVHVKGTV